MAKEASEEVNHFVTMPREQFHSLQVLKLESGSRTWLEFYGKLKKAKDQGLVKIDWKKIDAKKKKS